MIASDGTAMVADFGNARLSELTMQFTSTTKRGFSVRWAAPELLSEEGGSQVSREADVYAYGMTALEALTGELPYERVPELRVILLVVIQGQIPPRPNMALPDELWSLLKACWTREPAGRPSMASVRRRLQIQYQPLGSVSARPRLVSSRPAQSVLTSNAPRLITQQSTPEPVGDNRSYKHGSLANGEPVKDAGTATHSMSENRPNTGVRADVQLDRLKNRMSDSSFDDTASLSTYSSAEVSVEEQAARELERQRVLEAAGLIRKQAPPRPPGRRGPPPKVPLRIKRTESDESRRDNSGSMEGRPPNTYRNKNLPEPPVSPAESSLQIDDVYGRYLAFKESREGRMLMSSYYGANVSAGVMIPAAPVPPSATIPSLPSATDSTRLAIKSFFGRGPERDKERERRVISGPVSGPVFSPPISSAFGMSWSSLVDKSVVDGMANDERKRQEAIFELIATESAYVHDLQMIVEKFYATMVSVIDEKSATVIFANVEDILLCNTTFLSSLEERQKDCRLHIDQIGDILDAHMNGMTVYMPYCVHQAPAIKFLQGLRETNPELAAHLQRLRDKDPDIRNLDLSSYLLIPTQRIVRYPLMMKQILNHTHLETERALISHAIRTAERILDAVNDAIQEREGAERLAEISKGLYVGQGHLDLTAPTRSMGPRRLLQEGVLVKAKGGRRLHVVLCNDILVLMDAPTQKLYHMPMALTELSVQEGKDDITLLLQPAGPRGGDTIALRAGSAKDARGWIEAIERARAEAGRWYGAAGRRSGVGR